MTLNEYQQLASRTINSKLCYIDQRYHALHGMSSELGEVNSIFQHQYQGDDLIEDEIKKELGDLMWFVAEFAGSFGWTLDEVCSENIDKLRKRYPEGFDENRSKHRHELDT